jgi:predicted nucleic acid-binding protein
VDTVAWIALLNRNDGLHARAEQVMDHLRQQNVQLMTTEFVLLEVADALSAPALRSSTVGFIDGLRQVPVLRILPISHSLFQEGWQLYRDRPDKEWGLTDCTSLVAMTAHGVSEAFTVDHHFVQAGFQILL